MFKWRGNDRKQVIFFVNLVFTFLTFCFYQSFCDAFLIFVLCPCYLARAKFEVKVYLIGTQTYYFRLQGSTGISFIYSPLIIGIAHLLSSHQWSALLRPWRRFEYASADCMHTQLCFYHFLVHSPHIPFRFALSLFFSCWRSQLLLLSRAYPHVLIIWNNQEYHFNICTGECIYAFKKKSIKSNISDNYVL